MKPGLESKFIGCLVGCAVGDAVGELAFRYPNSSDLMEVVNRTDPLRYTDDTAMTLGLAQSLIERGDLDSEHLGSKFREEYVKEPWRGYASGPPTIFSLVEATGMSYVDAARTLFNGKGSFGNGAAMRVAPIGLFFHGSSQLMEKAFASAEVTHSHGLAKHGAALQAAAVALAVALDPGSPFPARQFLTSLLALGLRTELQEKIETIGRLLDDSETCAKAARTLGRSVAIHESLPFSIFAFLKHPESYKECLLCAVLNGGDRDTLGAMAGALSGAYLGIEAIPDEWSARVENRELLHEIALSLLRKSPSAPV